MAVRQKLSEIGWFYHAPEPPRKGDMQGIPLASQIPGLNDLSSIPQNDEPRPLFRDTDTKYIRLAKMGGREDLLRHRDPKPKPKDALPYPRNDWYYLEDNKVEDQMPADTNPWEFRLPEYMVHDEHRPFGDGYDYKNDPEGLIYWKKGRVVPGAPEIKHVSRAVTVEKPISAPAAAYAIAKPASSRNHESNNKSRYPDVPDLYDKQGRPAMNKLLAYGYATEWQAVRDDWYDKVQSAEHAEHRMSDEIARYNKSAKSAKNMMWNDMKSKHSQPVNASRRATSNTSKKEDKPLFKMSRFENVGARVNSHQKVLPPIAP